MANVVKNFFGLYKFKNQIRLSLRPNRKVQLVREFFVVQVNEVCVGR